MKKLLAMLLLVCIMLSGCAGFLDGSYVSVKPHQEENDQDSGGNANASTYTQLYRALELMVADGVETRVIYLSHYDQLVMKTDINKAVRLLRTDNPIAAYAVESITYEVGTSSGQPAVAVNVSYRHDRTQIRKIQNVYSEETAIEKIHDAMDSCADSIVLYMYQYQETDFVQLVEDYAESSPQTVMEVPRVSVNLYPDHGRERVVELKFQYQNSRDDLRSMQNEVRPVFDAAVLYVSGDGAQREKYSQLFSFLMERYDYQYETSITPAYSLLRHGVGDVKAFATVYAAMCNAAELECQIVTGTRWGEPWSWNMICDDGRYYHVDLLRCSSEGKFSVRSDNQMEGYVWDYSAFPECLPADPIPEETQPVETQPTEPETQPESVPEETVP